jgi:hypothetical protein
LLAEVRRLTTELAMAQASDERQELRADNARLRGLVKDAEVAAGESCGECPWCGAGPSTQHAPECPAFTESGDVR